MKIQFGNFKILKKIFKKFGKILNLKNQGYNMWDPENDPAACPRNGGGVYEPQCCGGGAKPFVLYNAARKYCCDNGRVVTDLSQC